MKEKRLLILLLSIFSGCSKENRTISIDNWNNQIITQLNKTDSLISQQEELKRNIDFLLEFRKDIAKEIDGFKSKQKLSNLVVYENYNCEYYPKDKIHTDLPFNKNKFYYEILIVSNKESYLYELKGFSENKNLKFIKKRFENKEDYLEFLNPKNIGKKKNIYLLNDFSVISKFSNKINKSNIEVISTRFN